MNLLRSYERVEYRHGMTFPLLVKRSRLHDRQKFEDRPLIKPTVPAESGSLKYSAGPLPTLITVRESCPYFRSIKAQITALGT
jgi:hypothetical protein